jgi:DNA-directed RNA polymerase specialized sigma24 family protein
MDHPGGRAIVTRLPRATGVDFETWLVARRRSLQRTAHLLTGDLHSAQDLVQNALAKLFLAWPRISQRDNLDAYARRVLVNEHRTLAPTGDPTRGGDGGRPGPVHPGR